MIEYRNKRVNTQHVMKLQAPFEPLKASCSENGELALFKSIITQSIIDATSTDNSKSGTSKKARDWIFSRNHSFEFACDCAGLEPDLIRKEAKDAIRANWAKRAQEKENL